MSLYSIHFKTFLRPHVCKCPKKETVVPSGSLAASWLCLQRGLWASTWRWSLQIQQSCYCCCWTNCCQTGPTCQTGLKTTVTMNLYEQAHLQLVTIISSLLKIFSIVETLYFWLTYSTWGSKYQIHLTNAIQSNHATSQQTTAEMTIYPFCLDINARPHQSQCECSKSISKCDTFPLQSWF